MVVCGVAMARIAVTRGRATPIRARSSRRTWRLHDHRLRWPWLERSRL